MKAQSEKAPSERARSETALSEFRETLNAAYRRFNALQRGEKRCFGVTLSQCIALELLDQQGPLPLHELARQLGLDASTMSRIVDVGVREGRLRRERDEVDRRRVYVSLTARGRALASRLEASADAYCARILERIPADRWADVIHALGILVEALDELPERCEGPEPRAPARPAARRRTRP
ncbi:MAG: MarR family winged helix-turn-helix transcriptional regulator [Myxococcota bacterium]